MSSTSIRTSESSEDGYDSEEERYMARLQAAGRGAALRAEAAAQAELLGAYRARQQMRQELEDATLRAKLEQQWVIGGGKRQAGGAGSRGQQAQSGWGCSSSGGAGDTQAHTRSWLHLLQQHEKHWQALEQQMGDAGSAAVSSQERSSSDSSSGSSDTSSGGGGKLAFNNVPWPPLDSAEYLQALAALEQQQQQQGTECCQAQGPGQCNGRRRAARRAYAHACLRWHPDKFVARWGALLAAEDRSAILHRVHQLSQEINHAWGVQQREWAEQQATTGEEQRDPGGG